MPSEIRDRALTLIVATAVVYIAFLVGWVGRKRLGIPPSRAKKAWVALIVVPLTFAGFLVADALLPKWAMTLLTSVGVVFLVPIVRARQRARERADPLAGREARVVRGHPEPLEVEVEGEVWTARTEDGLVVLQGERSPCKGAMGSDLWWGVHDGRTHNNAMNLTNREVPGLKERRPSGEPEHG